MDVTSTSAVNQANSIGIQDFLRILSAQLNNQDPLKPLDNQEFLSQIAQFSSLQQSQQLNQKIDQLLAQQAATQSVGLLGKTVTFNNGTGTGSSINTSTGQVSGLSFANGVASLSITLSNSSVLQNVSFSQIISIR
ncbi:MAG: hypothetical protein RL748_4193 [Pseudomonadota bacterium]|jgi:flagellar basal-body rod modification protein FlgD